MLSFDTNIAVYAANSASPFHARSVDFIHSLVIRKDVAICELMLVELYLKLRNEKIFSQPLSAKKAADICQAYRKNRSWMLVESAPVDAGSAGAVCLPQDHRPPVCPNSSPSRSYRVCHCE